MSLSLKQKGILDYIRQNGSITKQKSVELFGGFYYHNAEKYIGEILSNMVNKRYIKRVKNGLFEIGSMSNQLPGTEDKNQTNLF